MGPPSAFSNWPKSGLSPLISMVFVKIYTRWKRTTFAFLAMERRLSPCEISLDQSCSKRAIQWTPPRHQCHYHGTFNIVIPFGVWCWIFLMNLSLDKKTAAISDSLHQLEKLCQQNDNYPFFILQVLQKLLVGLSGGKKACGWIPGPFVSLFL